MHRHFKFGTMFHEDEYKIRQPSFGIQRQITEVYIHTMNNITSHTVVLENVHLQPEISQVQNTDQINIKNAIY